jgi:hypothetical protein
MQRITSQKDPLIVVGCPHNLRLSTLIVRLAVKLNMPKFTSVNKTYFVFYARG